MTPLLVATQNKGKIREFSQLLRPDFHCVSFLDAPYNRKAIPDVDETGTTYQENAQLKALAYFDLFQVPLLTDDSGLEVDALGGEPGVFSARYGGTGISWPERWDFLTRHLKSHPSDEWTARFRSVLCYVGFDRKPRFFEGIVEGRIISVPSGTSGFGYDPIFYSTELKKTFGEATDEEKASVSHRARAVAAFLQAMKS